MRLQRLEPCPLPHVVHCIHGPVRNAPRPPQQPVEHTPHPAGQPIEHVLQWHDHPIAHRPGHVCP
ncbi:MAG: hypothetical protein ACK559_24450, partial [bacterium]